MQPIHYMPSNSKGVMNRWKKKRKNFIMKFYRSFTVFFPELYNNIYHKSDAPEFKKVKRLKILPQLFLISQSDWLIFSCR